MSNVSRLSRKGGDYGGGDQSNMINLFSQGMRYYLRVSEEEYDFFCENGSDEELDMVVDGTVEGSTFAQKRLCLEVIRKYVGLYMDIQEGKDEKYSFE